MGNRWKLLIGCCAVPAVLLVLVGLTPPGEVSMETALAVLPGGGELVVELAVSSRQRSRGLMFRDELPEGQGMLLLFPENGFRSIWMKNVRFPLDLIWLDGEQRVVHLERNVPPCPREPCPDYHSMRQACAVLELNGGAVDKLGIALGQQLQFIPPLP